MLSRLSLVLLGVQCLFAARYPPEEFHRHLYTVDEFCETDLRTLSFREQVIIQSQYLNQNSYATNRSCTMSLDTANNDTGLMFAIKIVDTVDCNDYLSVATEERLQHKYCGRLYKDDSPNQSFKVANETLNITWITAPNKQPRLPGLGFQVVATAYTDECKADMPCYPCANGIFIHEHFVCNGRNNCGDLSDEKNCPEPRNFNYRIWLAVIFTAICAVVMFGFCFALWRYTARGERQLQTPPPAPLPEDERTPLFGGSSEAGAAYDPRGAALPRADDRQNPQAGPTGREASAKSLGDLGVSFRKEDERVCSGVAAAMAASSGVAVSALSAAPKPTKGLVHDVA